MSNVAIVGLGEAGAIYAAALAALGHSVTAADPVTSAAPEGVRLVAQAQDACADAEFVLVLTGAAASAAVADACLPVLPQGALYVDMTSASPALMRELADRDPEAFVDAAILGAVIALRERTPLIVSGRRSAQAAELLSALGARVLDVAGEPGDATGRKLVRSVAGKGLAAVVCEAMDAARAAGFGDWMRDELAALLPGDGHAVVDRYESGTRKHAARRAHEMNDVVAYLGELGVAPDMAAAAAAVHRRYGKEVTP